MWALSDLTRFQRLPTNSPSTFIDSASNYAHHLDIATILAAESGASNNDEHQSVAPPACTDASATKVALEEAFVELLAHAGDTTEHNTCACKGKQQCRVVINVIKGRPSATN
jgi:hypothetical protein